MSKSVFHFSCLQHERCGGHEGNTSLQKPEINDAGQVQFLSSRQRKYIVITNPGYAILENLERYALCHTSILHYTHVNVSLCSGGRIGTNAHYISQFNLHFYEDLPTAKWPTYH